MFDIEHAHNAYDPKTVWDKHFDEFIVRHYHDGEFGDPEWFNKENIINELGFVDDDGVYRFNFCPCTEVGRERIHEVILSQWFFSRVWRRRQKGVPTRRDSKLEYVLTYSFNYFGSVVAEMDLWFDKPQGDEGLGFGGALLRGVAPAPHPWSGMRWIADMAYPTSGDSDFLDVLAPWWRDALADFRDVLVASRKRVR